MNIFHKYFTDGVESEFLESVGAEIETQFVNDGESPITEEQSQQLFKVLLKRGWNIENKKGGILTKIKDDDGNEVFYELGRHNIEIATIATDVDQIIELCQSLLTELYSAADEIGVRPYFNPVIETNKDLLIVPDERDSNWVELDGRVALNHLTSISSVQFTIAVDSENPIEPMNKLGENAEIFLEDFPQDAVWDKYIKQSQANYQEDRYGGPLVFESFEHYCRKLAEYPVTEGKKLTPPPEVEDLEISLHLRSIWWHFRFRRYDDSLCIEVRPLPRRGDELIEDQLEMVLDCVH